MLQHYLQLVVAPRIRYPRDGRPLRRNLPLSVRHALGMGGAYFAAQGGHDERPAADPSDEERHGRWRNVGDHGLE